MFASSPDIDVMAMIPGGALPITAPLARGGRAGARSCSLLRNRSHRGGLCNGQRESSKLPSAGHAHSPGQLRLVAGALVPDLEALRAVRPAPVTLGTPLDTREAIICSSSGRRSPAAFPSGLGVLGRGLLRGRDGHIRKRFRLKELSGKRVIYTIRYCMYVLG